MTEQEFRKLKQLDLIQILLTQGNEVTMQQGDLDRKNERLELLLEENDIIKAKLNDRDAMTEMIRQKLNESDERIRELEEELKELYADRKIELEEAGSLVQAALELNKIFEAAQKEAEQYIQNGAQKIEGLTFDAASESTDHSGAEQIELKPEQPEIVLEQSELVSGQSELKSEQPELVSGQSELKSEQPELTPAQQAEDSVIGGYCHEEETISCGCPIEEETLTGEILKEEDVIKAPSEEEMSGRKEEEEKSQMKEASEVKEAPAAVSIPKPVKEPGQAKTKGLLRFFWKWKK